MSFKNIMSRMEDIALLKESKVNDFNSHIGHIRQIMTIIGKNSISLNTSEPLGPNHGTHGNDRKYTLTITHNNITFINNEMKTEVVDEGYLGKCKWFQVYIYVVEMELELNKVHNHLMDSLAVSERINGGEE